MDYAHIYLIKDGAGHTVKRVGHNVYHTARALALDWAGTLTTQTGQQHTIHKIRNTRNSGRGWPRK